MTDSTSAITVANPLPKPDLVAEPVNIGAISWVPLGATGPREALSVGLTWKVDDGRITPVSVPMTRLDGVRTGVTAAKGVPESVLMEVLWLDKLFDLLARAMSEILGRRDSFSGAVLVVGVGRNDADVDTGADTVSGQ